MVSLRQREGGYNTLLRRRRLFVWPYNLHICATAYGEFIIIILAGKERGVSFRFVFLPLPDSMAQDTFLSPQQLAALLRGNPQGVHI